MAPVQRINGSVKPPMRIILIALVACGGATPVEHGSAPTPTKRIGAPHEPVDVIASLSKPLTEAAAVVPGPASLVLGGPPLQAVEGADSVRGEILEEHGNDVRIGLRLGAVRFALWMPRARMLGVIARDVRIASGAHVEVRLHAGAQVRRLARKADRIQVRYVGAVEVEGWLSADVVAERGPVDRRSGVVPTNLKKLMVMPGAVIRSEPKWAGQQLAIINQSYFVNVVKAIDDAWVEVAYEDHDVKVHGFLSKRAPPGRLHRRPRAEPHNPVAAPNATAPNRTCLFINDEPIGFLDGAQPVLLESAKRVGWQTLTLDTPWHAITFDVRGTSESDLVTCGQ